MLTLGLTIDRSSRIPGERGVQGFYRVKGSVLCMRIIVAEFKIDAVRCESLPIAAPEAMSVIRRL